ncbi:hypothetical protein M9H77_18972 [Catharanthus roseus]|uniref:Uncharacterized protein n=1 Tax=Catharanthus roseus TaxID=4058 RepID=A0ACC0B907_CATRO|nr:hypothetical protein M9H77_18972 [Catharanthus roseus]
MNVDEEEKEQKMHKRSFKGNLQRIKRSLKTTIFYEDEVIKLKTLKTIRMENLYFTGKPAVQFFVMSKNWSSDFLPLRKSDVRIFSIQNENRFPISKNGHSIFCSSRNWMSYFENQSSGFYFYYQKMTFVADNNG